MPILLTGCKDGRMMLVRENKMSGGGEEIRVVALLTEF